MSYVPIKELAYALKSYYPNADQTEKTILNCAAVAATADAVGSLIPGLAIPATVVSCFGAVWTMYGLLCNQLGISLKENVLKLLARAALSNIVANLGGALAALVAGMLFPGTSIPAAAIIAFITVYLAGMVFLQLILKLADSSNDPHGFTDINIDEMKKAMKDNKLSRDDLDAAKQAFRQNQGKTA